MRRDQRKRQVAQAPGAEAYRRALLIGKDARISEIGGRGGDEEQARLPVARWPEMARHEGCTRSVGRPRAYESALLLVFTANGRSNDLGF